jgi:hypothetical protein
VDDDEQVRRIASLVGFRYPEALFEFLATAENRPYAEYKSLEHQFVTGVTA